MDDNDIIVNQNQKKFSNSRGRRMENDARTSTNRMSNQMIREDSQEEMSFDIENQSPPPKMQIEMTI